jgi:hypothetical protein
MGGRVLTKDDLLLGGSFVLDMSASLNSYTNVMTIGRSAKLRLFLAENINVYC